MPLVLIEADELKELIREVIRKELKYTADEVGALDSKSPYIR